MTQKECIATLRMLDIHPNRNGVYNVKDWTFVLNATFLGRATVLNTALNHPISNPEKIKYETLIQRITK